MEIINKIKTPKQTDITLFEISFSGLKNITSKKKFVFIVVDPEVCRHMCGAILSIRSTWTGNGKESIRGKRLVYVNMKEKKFVIGTRIFLSFQRRVSKFFTFPGFLSLTSL